MSDTHSSRLVVIGPGEKRNYLLCRCNCGVVKEIPKHRVTSGNTRSCGCLHRDQAASLGKKNTRHGKSHTRTHRIWAGMMDRCYNQNSGDWERYGGRGIRVCERWLGRDGFVNFIADMGESPPRLSLDRKDNDGPYSHGNCRWATCKEQQSNRRDNRNLTAFGETHTTTEWARKRGLTKGALFHRLDAGWELERALSTPMQRTGRRCRERAK